ncbi:MAG: hypothetical protein OEY59_06805 [Deltaproteobacteria bacterium]|nr:hypothetical protein [Deltaproteobacteria bacterium]
MKIKYIFIGIFLLNFIGLSSMTGVILAEDILIAQSENKKDSPKSEKLPEAKDKKASVEKATPSPKPELINKESVEVNSVLTKSIEPIKADTPKDSGEMDVNKIPEVELRVEANKKITETVPDSNTVPLKKAVTINNDSLADQSTSSTDAPQIMTTDLIRKQVVQNPVQLVKFVIIDDDLITKIEINGVAEKFESSDTVLIVKKFRFKPGKTIIKIKATDEKGHARQKSYLVGYGITMDTEEKLEANKSKLSWNLVIGTALENDSNPTNDLSTPIDLGDIELKGVVDDSEQTDTKQTFKTIAIINYDQFKGLLGNTQSFYSKEINGFLNTNVNFASLGYKFPMGPIFALAFDVLFTDINIGGYDYSVNQTLTAALKLVNKKKSGSTSTHVFAIDNIQKSFSEKEKQESISNTYKWTLSMIDKEKLDSYSQSVTFGNSTEGTTKSEMDFITFDWDWKNKWEMGLLWDLGFGVQRRLYKNDLPLATDTPLGEKRVDLPMRVSTGMGWMVMKRVKILFDYRYTFNLSNKTPYVRTISGLKIDGTF